MKALMGQILGAWLAFGSIAWFVRVAAPKSTLITCAYCGHPVPMSTATEGGVGAVNLAMREHITKDCEHHPMRSLEHELVTVRAAVKTIYNLAAPQPSTIDQAGALDSIRDLAGRQF